MNIYIICLLFSLPRLLQSQAYFCQVPNCLSCSAYNTCGLCINNYMLQINYNTMTYFCQQIMCLNISNCNTCYTNNICGVCQKGYYINANGTCTAGIAPNCTQPNCLYCSSSNTQICELCSFGSTLQNSNCYQNFENTLSHCISYFNTQMCQFCKSGFMVLYNGQCQNLVNEATCNLPNCQYCSTNTSCKTCIWGYYLSSTQQCIQMNIPNCANYSNSGNTCTGCISNSYNLFNGQCLPKIIACPIDNCLYCLNPSECFLCSPSYQLFSQTQGKDTNAIVCIPNNLPNPNIFNCLIYGQPIIGTSPYSFGCVACSQGFVNTQGACVANISISTVECNIQNCEFCVINNVCAQCSTGYILYYLIPNICMTITQPINNCSIDSIYADFCYLCEPEFIHNQIGACVQSFLNASCNVSGCRYCYDTDICADCMISQYNLVNGTCLPICNIIFCQWCETASSCQMCQFGYFINNSDSTACVSTTINNATQCMQKYGQYCQQCTIYGCTGCVQDAVYNSFSSSLNPQTYQCCPIPECSFAYCQSCNFIWLQNCFYTSFCSVCELGAIITMPYPNASIVCIKMLCSIDNCAYCYYSLVCIVCNAGYTLNQSICISYSLNKSCDITNCVECNTNNTQCTQCLNGYFLYYGQCVCPFQNCLQCIGSAFCTLCAPPLSQPIFGEVGCVVAPSNQLVCNITNCLRCTNMSICVQCFLGYSLDASGTCVVNICDASSNCLLCNSLNTICYTCEPEHQPSNLFANTCTPIQANYSCEVKGCALCSSISQCQACLPFFKLTDSMQCVAIICIANCAVCLENNTCLLCTPGFIHYNNNTCTATSINIPSCASIPSCVQCETSSSLASTVCTVCMIGLTPSPDGLSCIPQNCTMSNCQICLFSSQCIICQQGYSLNFQLQCVLAFPVLLTVNCSSIYNCIYCSINNYCSFCALGWLPINGSCITSLYCPQNCANCTSQIQCVNCVDGYSLLNNTCELVCTIKHCLSCLNETVCLQCAGSLQIINNKTACGCLGNMILQESSNTCINNDNNNNNGNNNDNIRQKNIGMWIGISVGIAATLAISVGLYCWRKSLRKLPPIAYGNQNIEMNDTIITDATVVRDRQMASVRKSFEIGNRESQMSS